MTRIKIEVLEDGLPSATITIPTWIITGASKLLPKIAGRQFQEHVDIDQFIALVKDPKASGTIIEIVDHSCDDRITISILGNE